MGVSNTRIVEGALFQLAAIGAGASVNIPLNGQSTFEVPDSFVLILQRIRTTIFATALFIDIIVERERTYTIAASSPSDMSLEPLVIVSSGGRVAVNVRNPQAAGAGANSAYSVHGVLVPSTDIERYWHQNLPPFVPGPL